MNVESFNLDHRAVAAPYVRLADRKQLPAGDVIVKYDVRFTQPNTAHLEMPTVHSLEHLFAEHSRNHSDAVLDFSPMGCQTGFYLMLQGEPAYEDVLALVEATMRDIISATEVPAANEVQCGWGANHTLEGAQEAASVFLSARGVWSQVFADGAPGESSADDAATRDAAAREAAARDAAVNQ
jgi:S-ribosylhomocysteine lyase